jgi:hypothetical protein
VTISPTMLVIPLYRVNKLSMMAPAINEALVLTGSKHTGLSATHSEPITNNDFDPAQSISFFLGFFEQIL